ncbi:NEDD8-activating enzyme E1 regulatory subunit, partial [Dissostichus eleginoides]
GVCRPRCLQHVSLYIDHINSQKAMAATKASKEQKYDRQLRLWGDHGQESLENAHVCLINATATGTEILKNLVLPGIGAFTIDVDGHTVSGEDVGN